jgi:hypothetical protein
MNTQQVPLISESYLLSKVYHVIVVATINMLVLTLAKVDLTRCVVIVATLLGGYLIKDTTFIDLLTFGFLMRLIDKMILSDSLLVNSIGQGFKEYSCRQADDLRKLLHNAGYLVIVDIVLFIINIMLIPNWGRFFLAFTTLVTVNTTFILLLRARHNNFNSLNDKLP